MRETQGCWLNVGAYNRDPKEGNCSTEKGRVLKFEECLILQHVRRSMITISLDFGVNFLLYVQVDCICINL